jgi:hypothetical protein
MLTLDYVIYVRSALPSSGIVLSGTFCADCLSSNEDKLLCYLSFKLIDYLFF